MEKKLNPKAFKYIFTSVIAACAGIFIIFISSYFSDKNIAVYENSYEEIGSLVADGYTKLAEVKLKGFREILETFYDDNVFKKGNTNDIVLHLYRNKDRLPDSFQDVFYFDSYGVSSDINGTVIPVNGRDYYNAIIYSGAKTFTTGATESLLDGTLVFIIARAVYDDEGKIKGGLCGTIRLYSFGDSFLNLNVIDKAEITILDKYGHYVINKKREKISKSYVPADKNYQKYRTENIVKMRSGSVLTKTAEGNTISLIFRPIVSANWVLCIVIPVADGPESRIARLRIRIILVFLSILVISFLFFCELKIMEYFQKKELLYISFDPATGLWSQDRFTDEADRIIRRNKKSKFMLIDCDIQGFNYITQKHDENEIRKLLKFTAREIQKTADSYQGLCCHGSSDHFYIFTRVSSVKKAMREFKEHTRKAIKVTDDYKIPFVLKFGIAFLLPEEKYRGLSVKALLNQTAIAKKNMRKDSEILYSIYDPRFLRQIQKEYFLESQCEKALEKGEFFVVYQPKISLKTEKIIGAEALVRWNQPEKGIIPPNDFIPLFERTGFVTKVDFYVYEQVLKYLDARIKAGLPVVQISVNMSRNHNKPERFINDFLEVFNRYKVPAKYIQVEILERSFSENRILTQITELLHKNGFTVAMDDFGTGESSLSMLTQVPIDVLKFDRSFLLSSTNKHGEIDRRSAGFIESFVGLSKRLEKETVFEGVETESQRDFLRVIDCDSVQGYFYSKPLNEEDFSHFLREHL